MYFHPLDHHQCLISLHFIHLIIYQELSSLLLLIHHIIVSNSITISNTTIFNQFQCGKMTIIVSPSIIPSSMPSMTPFYSSNDIPRAIIPPIINPSYHCFSINLSQSVIPLLFTNLNNGKTHNNCISIYQTIINAQYISILFI